MADQDAELRITAEADDLLAELKKIETRLDRLGDEAAANSKRANDSFDRLSKSTRTLSNLLKAAFTGAAVIGLKNLAEGAVKAAVAFERLETLLSPESFQFVREEANRLGFSLEEVADSFVKFEAATQGTAFEGEEARRIFSSLAEAMANLGADSGDLEGALKAVEQIISKGKVTAEELRQQLGDRLPGAVRIFADALGVTLPELEAFLQSGGLLAEDVLPKVARELQGRFTPALDTAQRNIERAKNALFELRAAAGRGLLEGLNQGLGTASLEANKVAKEIESLVPTITNVTAVLVSMARVLVEGVGAGMNFFAVQTQNAAAGLLSLSAAVARLVPGLDQTRQQLVGWAETLRERAVKDAVDFGQRLVGLQTGLQNLGANLVAFADQQDRSAESADNLKQSTDALTTSQAASGVTAAETALTQKQLETALREQEVATRAAEKAWMDWQEAVATASAEVGEKALEIQKGLAQASQEQAAAQTQIAELESGRAATVAELTQELEQLNAATQDGAIGTLEQLERLGEVESELFQQRKALAKEQAEADEVFFDNQQKNLVAQEEVKELIEKQREATEEVAKAFGDAGDVATTSLQQMNDGFDDITDILNLTGEEVQIFTDLFQSELERVKNQAKDSFESASDSAKQVAEAEKEVAKEAKSAGEIISDAFGTETIKRFEETKKEAEGIAKSQKEVAEQAEKAGDIISESFGQETIQRFEEAKKESEGVAEAQKGVAENTEKSGEALKKAFGEEGAQAELEKVSELLDEVTEKCQVLNDCLAQTAAI